MSVKVFQERSFAPNFSGIAKIENGEIIAKFEIPVFRDTAAEIEKLKAEFARCEHGAKTAEKAHADALAASKFSAAELAANSLRTHKKNGENFKARLEQLQASEETILSNEMNSLQIFIEKTTAEIFSGLNNMFERLEKRQAEIYRKKK